MAENPRMSKKKIKELVENRRVDDILEENRSFVLLLDSFEKAEENNESN
jgi:hypothetical protein